MIGQRVVAVSPLAYSWAVAQLRTTYGSSVTSLKYKSGEHTVATIVTALAQTVPAIDLQGQPDLVVRPKRSSALYDIVGDEAVFEVKCLDQGLQKFSATAAPRRLTQVRRTWSIELRPGHARIDAIVDKLAAVLADVETVDDALHLTADLRQQLGVGTLGLEPSGSGSDGGFVFVWTSTVKPLRDILLTKRTASLIESAARKTAGAKRATRHAFLVIDVLEHPFPEMTELFYSPYLPKPPPLPSGLTGLWILWTLIENPLSLSYWTRPDGEWVEVILSACGDLNNPDQPRPADFGKLATALYEGTHIKPSINVVRSINEPLR